MPAKKARVMGESKRVRKPRVRKSAPTIRERAEVAKTKAEAQKPKRIRTTLSKAARPLGKVKLPQNRATSALKKVLGWLVPRYFVNAWREVRLVTWPSRKETWRLTGAVFIFAIIFGALVAVVDKGLDEVFKKLVLK